MSDMVYWMLAVKINPGQLEPFKAVAAKLIESTKAEPGTLNYEWTLSEDSTRCHIYERYVNSAAIQAHVENNGEGVGQLFKLVTPESFHIYGHPSDEIRQALADLHPIYMAPLGGFARC